MFLNIYQDILILEFSRVLRHSYFMRLNQSYIPISGGILYDPKLN